jgi:hypothetical protein
MRSRAGLIPLAALPLWVLNAFAGAETEIENWPCKAPYRAELAADDVWGGPAPKAAGDWHADEAVRAAVTFAANPENTPVMAGGAVSDLAHAAGAAKDRALALTFHGMLEETNALRTAVMAGIRDYTLRAIILGDAVQDNDAELAALAKNEEAEKRRQDIRAARQFNFRNKDDAEEEADFLCHRLAYAEKKLRAMVRHLKAELEKP